MLTWWVPSPSQPDAVVGGREGDSTLRLAEDAPERKMEQEKRRQGCFASMRQVRSIPRIRTETVYAKNMRVSSPGNTAKNQADADKIRSAKSRKLGSQPKPTLGSTVARRASHFPVLSHNQA